MSDTQQDKIEIQAVLDKVFSTYIDKDIEGMLSCYSTDLVTIMPFGMPTYGLDQWRKVLESAFERFDLFEVVSDTEEILLLGDWAWVWYYEWAKRRRIENDEHFANFIRGGVMMNRQDDGSWKIARYIANVVNLEPHEVFEDHVAGFREHSARNRIMSG